MPANSAFIQQPSEESGGSIIDPIQHPAESASGSRTNNEINIAVTTETFSIESGLERDNLQTSNNCSDFPSTNSKKLGLRLLRSTYPMASSSHKSQKRFNQQPFDQWDTQIRRELSRRFSHSETLPSVARELPNPRREN